MDDNKKIRIGISNGFCTEQVDISEVILKNDEIERCIDFSIWDDFSFGAYENADSELEKVEFTFDIDDPLYFSLNRLLGMENSFIIDDDDTSEELQKYMVISRENNRITITFYNKKKESSHYEKFGVFIKNIGPDARSKIHDFSTKIRLIQFFKEAKEILLNDNHQYTLDEYYEILKNRENSCKINPFLKSKLKKIKNPGECCQNCDFGLSPLMLEYIISENSKYQNMSEDDAIKEIGTCEYEVDYETQLQNDFWCERYLPTREYKQLIKR